MFGGGLPVSHLNRNRQAKRNGRPFLQTSRIDAWKNTIRNKFMSGRKNAEETRWPERNGHS